MQEVAERTGAGAAGGAGGVRTTRTRAMGTPVEGSRPGRPSLPPGSRATRCTAWPRAAIAVERRRTTSRTPPASW